jgi:hypothetical protein
MVEVITWNDYGESHYIGPLHSEEYDSVFGPNSGQALYNYADGMSHDGWRATLPWFIEMYKTGSATIGQESLTAWYRPYPASSKACDDDLTVGKIFAAKLDYFNLTVFR